MRVILFNKLKIIDIFSSEKSFEQTFDYNISILKEIDKLNDLKISPIEKFTFIFKNTHQKEINKYLKIFGSDTVGLTKEYFQEVYLKNFSGHQ